jgi:hypothetical protein
MASLSPNHLFPSILIYSHLFDAAKPRLDFKLTFPILLFPFSFRYFLLA